MKQQIIPEDKLLSASPQWWWASCLGRCCRRKSCRIRTSLYFRWSFLAREKRTSPESKWPFQRRNADASAVKASFHWRTRGFYRLTDYTQTSFFLKHVWSRLLVLAKSRNSFGWGNYLSNFIVPGSSGKHWPCQSGSFWASGGALSAFVFRIWFCSTFAAVHSRACWAPTLSRCQCQWERPTEKKGEKTKR